jgi:hypothetical protein
VAERGGKLRALRREPRPPTDAELEAARGLLKAARRDVRRRRVSDAVLADALRELGSLDVAEEGEQVVSD